MISSRGDDCKRHLFCSCSKSGAKYYKLMAIFGKGRFSYLTSVSCFPVLGTRCLFSRPWYPLFVFPPLAPAACFPALGTRAPLVFPPLAPAACFPSLGTRRLFSLPWHPRAACFPALGVGCMFSFRALIGSLSRLHFFCSWLGVHYWLGLDLRNVRTVFIQCLLCFIKPKHYRVCHLVSFSCICLT